MGMLDDVKAKKKQKAADNWMKMADTAKTIEKQIEYYTKSLDIDPYNAEAWFKKGKALENLGRFEEAKRCFDLAIEIDPDYQGLIGRKYESKAAHEVNSEPVVVETPTPVPEPSTPVMEEEPVAWDQWVTETPEISEEDSMTVQEAVQEEESSFVVPSDDESAFGNIVADQDNGSPASAVMEEEEDDGIPVFSAVSNGLEKEHVEEEDDGIPVFSAVSNGLEKEHVEEKDDDIPVFSAVSNGLEKEHVEEEEEMFTPAPSQAVEVSSSVAADENVISEVREAPVTEKPASVNVEERPAPVADYSLPAKPVENTMAVAPSGDVPVDIRIPMSEAIKFWAIGIIAMLIVMLLSSVILGQ